MISDTLADAISEIRAYIREYPEVYEGDKRLLDGLLNKMDEVRAYFDA